MGVVYIQCIMPRRPCFAQVPGEFQGRTVTPLSRPIAQMYVGKEEDEDSSQNTAIRQTGTSRAAKAEQKLQAIFVSYCCHKILDSKDLCGIDPPVSWPCHRKLEPL